MILYVKQLFFIRYIFTMIALIFQLLDLGSHISKTEVEEAAFQAMHHSAHGLKVPICSIAMRLCQIFRKSLAARNNKLSYRSIIKTVNIFLMILHDFTQVFW